MQLDKLLLSFQKCQIIQNGDLKKRTIWLSYRRHYTQHNDTQHNDIRHNDTQYKGLICDTQHKWQSA